jgi:hypothetical protein
MRYFPGDNPGTHLSVIRPLRRRAHPFTELQLPDATATPVYGFVNQMRFRSISAPRLRKKSLSSGV